MQVIIKLQIQKLSHFIIKILEQNKYTTSVSKSKSWFKIKICGRKKNGMGCVYAYKGFNELKKNPYKRAEFQAQSSNSYG